MEIGLPEYMIADQAQPNPDQLLCRKGCNSLVLFCGIANSGLVGAGLQIPPSHSAQSFNSKSFLASFSFQLFLVKI
jgi:hypothetical protein